VAILRGLKIQF